MAGPPFSPEWSQNGHNSPSPNDHERRIPDRLGRDLRHTGMQSLDRRVSLLAHKLHGAESHLPSTDSFSPFTQGVSCDCQDGQHGGSIPYKSPRGFTVTHPKQACTEFLSLRAVHVPGVLNLAADFLSRQKLRSREWMLNR